jgi:hypothetical protein
MIHPFPGNATLIIIPVDEKRPDELPGSGCLAYDAAI